MGENQHVYPIDDLREHDTSSSRVCACLPRIVTVAGNVVVVVHNAWDGREISQQAIDHAFGSGAN